MRRKRIVGSLFSQLLSLRRTRDRARFDADEARAGSVHRLRATEVARRGLLAHHGVTPVRHYLISLRLFG